MAYHRGEGLGQGSPGLGGIGALGVTGAQAGVSDCGVWGVYHGGVSISGLQRGICVRDLVVRIYGGRVAFR